MSGTQIGFKFYLLPIVVSSLLDMEQMLAQYLLNELIKRVFFFQILLKFC